VPIAAAGKQESKGLESRGREETSYSNELEARAAVRIVRSVLARGLMQWMEAMADIQDEEYDQWQDQDLDHKGAGSGIDGAGIGGVSVARDFLGGLGQSDDLNLSPGASDPLEDACVAALGALDPAGTGIADLDGSGFRFGAHERESGFESNLPDVSSASLLQLLPRNGASVTLKHGQGLLDALEKPVTWRAEAV